MSTLQISLAVAGGLVLAVVVAHGAWSTRKNQPKRATPPEPLPESREPRESHERQDPGAPREPIEPQIDALTGASAELDPSVERHEPSFDVDSGLQALTQLSVPDRKAGLDILIDAMVPVSLETVVSGDAALAAMPATRRVGSKPFGVEGRSVVTGQWEFPAAGHRYNAFQCGVQLANRTGPLNQIEFYEFVITTQAFADAIDGQPEFPEMHEEVTRARELDQFASSRDAQLSLTLRANRTAWSPGYVQQNAAKVGFTPGAIPGRMVLPAQQAGHGPILGLSFDTQAAMAEDPEQTALHEITLSLDVPQVLRSEQPFARMCELAITLASNMDGVIIDDNGNLIRPEAMEAIHADLETLYDALDERDLAAGSLLCRRLFS